MSADIWSFIKEEAERLRQERIERLGGEILRIEPGQTYVIELRNENWRRVTTRFGERIVIPILHNNEPKVLMLNPRGRLYRMLVEELAKLADRKPERVVVTIKREGVGRLTNYTVKAEPVEEAKSRKRQYQ